MTARTWTAVLGALLLIASAGIAEAADQVPSSSPVTVMISADGIQRATITLDSYSYAPNHLIVDAGKPVELTLTSITTVTPHNFVMKEPTAGIAVDETVWGGKTATIRFTPTQAGSFAFFCDKRLWPLPSHRDKGMEGKLEVR